MDINLLLYIVEHYTGHEHTGLNKVARRSWNLLKLKCDRIVEQSVKISVDVPADAKDCEQMLEEILERLEDI